MALFLNSYDIFPSFSYRPVRSYNRYHPSFMYSLSDVDYFGVPEFYTNYYVISHPKKIATTPEKCEACCEDAAKNTKEKSTEENKNVDNSTLAPFTDMKAWNIKTTEDADKVIISAYLPGVNKDKISIEVHGDNLYLSAERIVEKKNEHFSTSNIESISRVLALPKGAAPETISAKFDNDTLNIEIPLPKEVCSKSTKIEIKPATSSVATIISADKKDKQKC